MIRCEKLYYKKYEKMIRCEKLYLMSKKKGKAKR